jgi:hypothetical protein
MNVSKTTLLALLLYASFPLQAQQEQAPINHNIDRIILNFSIDKQDNFHPDVSLPVSWNDSLSSAFSYYSTADYENGKVLNLANSNNDTEINYRFINIYPLLWQSAQNTYGIDVGIIDIDKTQVGFFSDNSGTFNFVNDLSIQLIKPSLFYRFNQLSDSNNGWLYAVSVSPYSELSLTQSTLFSGALNQAAVADASTESNLSLRLALKARFKSANGLQSYVDVHYEYLPMEYTLAVLNSNGSFTSQQFDVVEHIFKASYKIKFDLELFRDLKPVIGVSYEKTDGKESNANDRYDYERYLVVFGIEG